MPQIGIAATAFYPDITLSAESGIAAAEIARLVSASSQLWSFGGDLGARPCSTPARARPGSNRTVATFDRNVALYRQTVLDALREVEDQLVALRILAEQEAALEAAVTASREAERIISNQYLAGTVPYTSVVVAQAAALTNAQAALDVKQSRLLAAVALIEALGGGWEAAQLPSRERIERTRPARFQPAAAAGRLAAAETA